jgi:hypothetical protein
MGFCDDSLLQFGGNSQGLHVLSVLDGKSFAQSN